MSNPAAPRSLGKFESVGLPSRPTSASPTTPSATRRVCSGRSAVAARPVTSSRRIRWRPSSSPPPVRAGVNPPLQRLHPPQLQAEREHAAHHRGGLRRHRRGPARWLPRPGQVRDVVDRDEARRAHSARHVDDRDERLGLQGSGDGQLLVALVRGLQRPRGGRLVRAGDPFPRRARPAEHPAGRLLSSGERVNLGCLLVADRSDPEHRVHGGCLPRGRRASHRPEGRPLHDADERGADPRVMVLDAGDVRSLRTWKFACPWTDVVVG